jgi:hypothetical protein
VTTLAAVLEATWARQQESGFLLGDPDVSEAHLRLVPDHVSGVEFRLRWLPHRELRTDVAELERRGILNAQRDEASLFHDPRDPSGRYCFLCPDNIRQANPLEELIPITLAGGSYFAGANFAWISQHHFTVMSAQHTDQQFTGHVLDAMLDLHRQAGGGFRVIYNGSLAGATIPWHLHYQITSEPFPVEALAPGSESTYPTDVQRFTGKQSVHGASSAVADWEQLDPGNHRVNLLVSGPATDPVVHVFKRDTRLTRTVEKGLIGGFEVCGDLVYSEPGTRQSFEQATAETVRATLESINPLAS